MQKRWAEIVIWCIAFGVPMTPLAGTWLGYGVLGIAGVILAWRGWQWVNDSILVGISPQARASLVIPSLLLIVMAAVWSFYGGLPALISLKNETLTAQDKKISQMESGKFAADKTEDNRTVSQLKPLVRIEGRKFVNEKVELDGHSYVNCDFENVTFVYNGGLSEVFNSRVKYESRLRFETTSVPVQQVIKMFRGMGLFHPDSIVPDPAVR